MRRLLACLAVTSLLSTAGCALYFGGEEEECTWGGDAPQPGTPAGYLNPFTGECEYWGGGGGGGGWNCEGAVSGDSAGLAQPSWAMCETTCTGLGEEACLDAPGCRAGYADTCGTGGCAPEFRECWAVDQTGPIQGGTCEGLDAWECSRHDDCIAIHEGCGTAGAAEADRLACPLGAFNRCAAEPATNDNGCYEDSECAPNERCNASEVCLPPPGCGGTDPSGEPTPGGDGNVPCPAVCYGECVPRTDEPGECYTEPACDSLPPECPADTLPGVKDGCYSGFCIPVAECPDTPAACDTLTTEAACVARGDCVGLYEGVGCTCDASGCSCSEWVFESCTKDDGTDPAAP